MGCDDVRKDHRRDSASYYKQNYPNEGQRFVVFGICAHPRLDAAQTKLAITDGADDKQIDAIVIDDDAQSIAVVQGKFIGASCNRWMQPTCVKGARS